jgi:hypothetical protein
LDDMADVSTGSTLNLLGGAIVCMFGVGKQVYDVLLEASSLCPECGWYAQQRS